MKTERGLNLNDLAIAWRLPEEQTRKLADPLLSQLRSLSMPGGRDSAGIPYRGTEVFRELMEGRSIGELRAAYVTFRRLDCQTGVIDALEFALGIDDV